MMRKVRSKSARVGAGRASLAVMLMGAWWVAGCDAVPTTVSGEEQAASAGVELASAAGALVGLPCGGIAGLGCPGTQFCVLPPGSCAVSDALGQCLPKPLACLAVFDPVCGCNGTTYGNACEARKAGAQVDHAGPCDPACTGDAECQAGQYCKRPHCSAEQGDCANKPQTCPRVWQPVCGCDGKTYANECFLAKAGVTWAHDGKCDTQCGGLQGLTCPAPQVCIFPVGSCGLADGVGKCMTPAEVCPLVYAPVCGCDGVTYANQCFATAAGATIQHVGPCKPAACEGNDDCPGELMCRKKPGLCEEGTGKCVESPAVCALYFLPACGCDGLTYANPCLAASHGVNVAHFGPCACPPEPACDFDQVPADGDGDGCNESCQCGVAIKCAPGFVAFDANSNECPDSCAPACETACDCYDSGLDLDFAVPCPLLCPTCGNYWTCEEGMCTENCGAIPPKILQCLVMSCTSNTGCAAGEYCAKAAGTCEGEGSCQPKPQGCAAVFDPVCGCDGLTYSNGCDAAGAGVNVSQPGQCPPATCESNAGCNDAQFCRFPDAQCATVGVCAARPQVCPTVYDPVCGCDGQTYGNTCAAASAGSSVESKGTCPDLACGSDFECLPSEYCQFAAGECGGPGQCAPFAEVCPAVFDPVCGCNGQTYSNSCKAASVGISVSHPGPCP